MSKQGLTFTAIGCFIACAICLFIAIERYNTNANNVEAMNQMMDGGPFGGSPLGGEMEPATPAATKYAIFFAILTAAGGVTCLVLANKQGPSDPPSV